MHKTVDVTVRLRVTLMDDNGEEMPGITNDQAKVKAELCVGVAVRNFIRDGAYGVEFALDGPDKVTAVPVTDPQDPK